ncbi:MAG: hypothetical protein WD266_10195 [Balneolales bacterium]
MKAFPLSTYLVALILVGCTVDGLESIDGQQTILPDGPESKADLYIASRIIGESLSEKTDGVIASLNDAFETPSAEGFREAISDQLLKRSGDSDSLTEDPEYAYEYIEETGKHEITLNRQTSEDGIEKETQARLSYVFYDNSAEPIRYPGANRDKIEIIDFSGERTGSITTYENGLAVNYSTYQRADNYRIDGLAFDSPSLTIEGNYEGQGRLEGINAEKEAFSSDDYSIKIKLLNVQVNKTHFEDHHNFRQGVTGGLEYVLTPDQDSETRLTGNVELTGDGTALLKFRNFNQIFTLTLMDNSPDMSSPVLSDDDLMGNVSSVNEGAGFFILFNSKRVRVDENTRFLKQSEFASLKEVREAIKADITVEAHGKLDRKGRSHNYTATEVEFRTQRD